MDNNSYNDPAVIRDAHAMATIMLNAWVKNGWIPSYPKELQDSLAQNIRYCLSDKDRP